MHAQSHTALFVAMPGIPPTERHTMIFKRQQTVSRYGNAVRITTQVAYHLLGPAKWAFRVDYPVFLMDCSKQFLKGPRSSERRQHALQNQGPGRVQLTETLDELTPKDFAEHLHWQEEPRGRTNPSGVILRETARRNDTMDMWMMLQLLIPGMQDTEESDLRSQMLGISRDFEQCISAGAHEQAVNGCFVLEGEWSERTGDREHYVRIGSGQ
jgi:hypothetical protein